MTRPRVCGIDAERITGIDHPAASTLKCGRPERSAPGGKACCGTMGPRKDIVPASVGRVRRARFRRTASCGASSGPSELGPVRPSAPRRPAGARFRRKAQRRSARSAPHSRPGSMASRSGARQAAITAVWTSPANAPAICHPGSDRTGQNQRRTSVVPPLLRERRHRMDDAARACRRKGATAAAQAQTGKRGGRQRREDVGVLRDGLEQHTSPAATSSE